MRPVLDAARLDDFARRIAAHPKRRVDRASLWRAFAGAFPVRPQGAEEREWLSAALACLSERGIARFPSRAGSGWDRTLGVELPAWVEVSPAAPPAARDWRAFPWHRPLAWVADLRNLTEEHERFLRRVHDGLVAGWFARPAPMKYRSLQLTGDEKRLAQLARTVLFGRGRLDYELLGCVDDLPPLAWERISDRAVAIVFENSGPFWVASQVLSAMARPPYGIVACGEGARFQRSYRQLARLRLERVEYVGDLDYEGLRIAAGTPGLAPAEGMHVAMLASAAAFGFSSGWPCESRTRRLEPRMANWLPAEVRDEARAVIEAGLRIPEEVMGPDEFAQLWGI